MQTEKLLKDKASIAANEFKESVESLEISIEYLSQEMNQFYFYQIQKRRLDPALKAELATLRLDFARLSEAKNELAALIKKSSLTKFIQEGEELMYEIIQPRTTDQRA